MADGVLAGDLPAELDALGIAFVHDGLAAALELVERHVVGAAVDVQVAVARVAEAADGDALRLAGGAGIDEKLRDAVDRHDDVHLVEQLRVRLDDGQERAARGPDVLFQAVGPDDERVVRTALLGKRAEAVHLRGQFGLAVTDEGDEDVCTGLFAVHDRGEDGVAGERRRGIDDVALHELDRLRVEVGQLDLRYGGDGGLHIGKRENEAHVHFRLGDELERQLRDDAERALRADHQVQQAVAGAGLAHGLAELHDSAVGQHHGHGQHVVARDAVLHGAHAARVRGHVAAHGRGLLARVGRIHQAVRERVGRKVAQQHAGLDVHDEVVHVIGEDLIHARRAQHHAAAQRHASADEARAGAARRDGDVIFVAHT